MYVTAYIGAYAAMYVSSLLKKKMVPCKRVLPGFCSGFGWMIKCLNNTSTASSDTGLAQCCMPVIRVATAWYDLCSAHYDNMRSEYGYERGFRAGSGKFCTIFGPVRPAGAGTTKRPSGRQLQI